MEAGVLGDPKTQAHMNTLLLSYSAQAVGYSIKELHSLSFR